MTRTTAEFYKIPTENAARLHLMAAIRQIQLYERNKRSPWDTQCKCDDDFDPMMDCEENGMGPLDPRC